jgi:hypothetical protein
MSCVTRSGDGLQKLAWPYFECSSQRDYIQECNVPFPALAAADIVAVEVSEFSQLLLGQAAFEPEGPHPPAK